MGGLAALLVILTVLDYTARPGSSNSPAARVSAARPVAAGPPAPNAAWQEIRALSRLRENAAAVTNRYQALAVPYAETMAEVAVLHGAGEKPEAAAKRAIGALLPPVVQVKALLVADGAVTQQGNTRLTVNLSLESADSRALQLAVMALGNPAAGLVWRELALSADSETRLIRLTGLLSVLAIRHAE